MKKIYLNFSLLISGLILCLIDVGLCVFFVSVTDIWYPNDPDNLTIKIIFIVLGLAMLIGCMLAMPRWYAYIKLSNGSIEFKKAFHKKETIPYEKYNHIYKATYCHGRIIPFIILSQKHIDEYALKHINLIPASREIIKIKYSKSVLDFLIKNLDKKRKSQLIIAFHKELNVTDNK